MHATQNLRYRKAASDYLHRPMAHPVVIRAAATAAQIADLAAFEYLRSIATQKNRTQEVREP